MKTNLIVKTLCLLLVLIFSGCASKEVVYVPQKCLVEKPSQFPVGNCRVLKSDFEFMQCVAENYAKLKADYAALEVAFMGCK